MLDWKYNPEDYGRIKPIEPGKYRVRIEKAEEAVSKNTGKNMIKLTLKVSGHNQLVWNYIVFPMKDAHGNIDPEEKERTNNNLGRIFDSFNIEQGNLNVASWEGKVGAAEIDNRMDDQGNLRSNVKFFLKRNQQEFLPAWQEHEIKTKQSDNVNSEMVNLDDGLPPF